MSQQHKQGRPQGRQQGGYEDSRRQTQGSQQYGSSHQSNDWGTPRQSQSYDDRQGSYGDYGQQEFGRGDPYGQFNRQGSQDQQFDPRHGNQDFGNYGRQEFGNSDSYGTRPNGPGYGAFGLHNDGRHGHYGMRDTGTLRGYSDMAYGRSGSGSEGRESPQSQQHSQHQHNEFDPDYLQWRHEQVQGLDEDYRSWRQDRFKKFSDEFSTWRGQRSTSPTHTEPGGSKGMSTAGSRSSSSSSDTGNDHKGSK